MIRVHARFDGLMRKAGELRVTVGDKRRMPAPIDTRAHEEAFSTPKARGRRTWKNPTAERLQQHLSDPLFWVYIHICVRLFEVFHLLLSWAEGCSCHHGSSCQWAGRRLGDLARVSFHSNLNSVLEKAENDETVWRHIREATDSSNATLSFQQLCQDVAAIHVRIASTTAQRLAYYSDWPRTPFRAAVVVLPYMQNPEERQKQDTGFRERTDHHFRRHFEKEQAEMVKEAYSSAKRLFMQTIGGRRLFKDQLGESRATAELLAS
ncbi:unnamed protein product [Vitrella brassicaformis CCMP3155]|uniref:Uncharacterized protein n=1 Tax=Vitrella brassicaformis (strain CCMP3155) TaxID=1169540 RepID=A0A0G4GFH3_VITBC|nr:unnamed protein product [Vitrella brassicaformis CCMP3155]|eukprot:CEM28249.1 unnamed protein product [Vitrella brassicaformis CCMP3155]